MADRGVPIETIARLSGRKPSYVREYIRRRGDVLRGGPAPLPLFLHDRPQPRPANLPDPDRRWRARLDELEAFLAQHQRRPHASRQDPNRGAGSEWALSHWLIVQRTEDRNGRLAEHRVRALERVLPSWRIDDRTIDNEANWRLRLVELTNFTAEHGRNPSRKNQGDAEEVGLAAWLEEQHLRNRDGRLDPERKAWLDR